MSSGHRTRSQSPAGAEAPTWPGERHPLRGDVEIATQALDPSFVTAFKNNLLASSTMASPMEPLMRMRLDDTQSKADSTYPMSILYNFPAMPPDDVISAMQDSFARRFSGDVLLSALPKRTLLQPRPAPYFKLSLACLACAAGLAEISASEQRHLAMRLFLTGNSLWNVMLEVENTEARTLEGVLSPILLSLYGVLTAEADVWSLVQHQMLPSACTMARRLRLHESNVIKSSDISTSATCHSATKSSVMALLLLVNVLSALHMNASFYLTSNELLLGSRKGSIEFHRIYSSNSSFEDHDDDDNRLARLCTSDKDPLILLLGILADAIYVRRSLSGISTFSAAQKRKAIPVGSSRESEHHAPHTPLSAPAEQERMLDRLSTALDDWARCFESGKGRPFMALYYFCRLYLSCPRIAHLPRLAGYRPVIIDSATSTKDADIPTISNEAVTYAWSVLSNIDFSSGAEQSVCTTWLPIVLFLAGLVVWTKTQQDAATHPMQMIAFKSQLERMPWPCCAEMAETLGRLMQRR